MSFTEYRSQNFFLKNLEEITLFHGFTKILLYNLYQVKKEKQNKMTLIKNNNSKSPGGRKERA